MGSWGRACIRVQEQSPWYGAWGLCLEKLMTLVLKNCYLWPPCVADADIIFLPCGFFFFLSSFFPRLISTVADWMSTILPHMVWP